ncbi:hypothetical protein O181_001240 [Austropuccinia psidii MF-1]|uniref:Integrase catalytic domain-containing protein n=1 Tax=Austropuccinia psidii MF-1 TaxID=1389203 RepID=A0A9Q3BA97_9BASI|nr:hypothetical protein [Austropuccinia psidii MF-1]
MKIHLRAKDLLDVCEKSLPGDATIPASNKWTKESYDAINIITTRISERVFLEVINSETTEKANLLWSKINEQYASKRLINRGRVWMDWQRFFYNGNLQNFIDSCRKLLMELETVSIKIPNELLSYSLLGKLGGDSNLQQLVESLTLNDELIERPNLILTRLQDYVHLAKTKEPSPVDLPSALVSTTNESFKIIHYCTNGKHNPKSTTHKREECWAENPQLRPNRKDNKRKKFQSTAKALVTSSSNSQTGPSQVILDCGATHHMFNSKAFFTSLRNTSPFSVTTGDSSSSLEACGTGTVVLYCKNQPLTLYNCLFVPRLICNLISLLTLFKKKVSINRVEEKFTLESEDRILLEGRLINRLMHIDYTLPSSLLTVNNQSLWHKRLGHPSSQVLKLMGLPSESSICSTCEINKAHQQPFNQKFDAAIKPLDCIHLDLVGPIVPASVSGFHYILTIVDQSTSFKIVKFLKNKSDTFSQFSIVKIFMENQQDRKIKRIVSDRGGEFLNKHFKNLAEVCGITHILSPAETPQHNGYAERANRTILEKTRCLLGSANLPDYYWAEASPRVKRLRTFGCLAFIANPRKHRTWKMGPAGVEGILLGYENENTAYRILRISDAKVIITKHATFDETKFPSLTGVNKEGKLNLSEFTMTVDESRPDEAEEDANCSETVDEIRVSSLCEAPPPTMVDEVHGGGEGPLSTELAPVTPARIKVIGPRHPTLISSDIDNLNILPYTRRADALLTLADATPRTYKEALTAPNKDLWLAAIDRELSSMKKLQVWDIVERHDNFRLIGTTPDFAQTQGIDFEKMYAPTGCLNSLRTLIAFAAAKGLEFHQIDIKSAFLNAPLSVEVFLHVPQGLELDNKRWCLRLNKAIYGLKQAPLAWYECLKEWLVGANFQACILDPCVFYRAGAKPIWLYLHVDDIAVFGSEIADFKKEIAQKFEIKDLGPADLLLGVKITQKEGCVYLDQQHFCESLLDQYGMSECKSTCTPLVPKEQLLVATQDEVNKLNLLKVNYRSAIGSINYLSTATRPELCFAVSSLSQYLENPGVKHWHAFLHVLWYLKGSLNVGLKYKKNGAQGISAWSDADWGNCCSTRRSVTGYLATFHGGLALWKTRKQPLVSISTAEAEYKALCDLTSELMWLKQWCAEAQILRLTQPITVWEDNQSCINIANGNCNFNNQRMKHVDIQLHFVKEVIQSQQDLILLSTPIPKSTKPVAFSIIRYKPPSPVKDNENNVFTHTSIYLI